MKGDFIAYYLSEQEFKKILEEKKRFIAPYKPYLSIRVIENLSEETFEGIVCEGTNFDRGKCIKKYEGERNPILIDYYEGRPGSFTFDGMRYFKINGIQTRSDEEGLIIFTFQFVHQFSFSEKNTAFMIMPFKYEELNSFYKKNIEQFLFNSELAIKVLRADDFTGTDVIADTILEQIRKAEFIICDITNCNKNVFFEIGYAKALNKNVIFLLEQNKPAEFFDVNHIRRIEYSYEKESEFQSLLRDTLISVRNTSAY